MFLSSQSWVSSFFRQNNSVVTYLKNFFILFVSLSRVVVTTKIQLSFKTFVTVCQIYNFIYLRMYTSILVLGVISDEYNRNMASLAGYKI